VNLIPLPWPQDGAGMKFCRAVLNGQAARAVNQLTKSENA
jgi:hypothetical protein